jgi:exopolyphosphatase/guanosine-5'-triphosphate,3'-diphosphate pyrophosphatase
LKKAVIDIGTNSCRLFIGEVENQKIIKKILKIMKITKLGEGVDKTKKLSIEGMDRTVEALKMYRNEIDKYNIKEIKVIATSATRDSENRDEFIERVKKEANLKIDCIDGKKEGTLSFKGAISEFNTKIMVLDIGGGSTEFILGDSEKISYIESFNIGAVRLNEKFFLEGNRVKEGKEWTDNLLKKLKKYRNDDFILVGVAGTVTTHVSVLLEMEEYDTNRVHMYNLTKDEIEKNLKLFLTCSLEERKKILGLHPKRAEVIVAGSYLLLWIMDILNKDEIIVSESDILEGLILDD